MKCKEVEEGKTPPRSCYICRRADCPVWQELTGKEDSSVSPSKDKDGRKVQISFEEIAEDEGYEPEEERSPRSPPDGTL